MCCGPAYHQNQGGKVSGDSSEFLWVSTGCKATKVGLQVAMAKAAKLESDFGVADFGYELNHWLEEEYGPTPR